MCLPKIEGGLGFGSLHDTSKALFGKLWWNLRTTRSLWSAYMVNKYNKKFHPAIAQAKGYNIEGLQLQQVICKWWTTNQPPQHFQSHPSNHYGREGILGSMEEILHIIEWYLLCSKRLAINDTSAK
ncbi:hypothetical protein KY290_037934 [Solanum tuberosum]|uniref:Reverse transcriptase n=1 Tax=Solanum tuberosum TaxID=4113 RepID=A0ABQ7TY65_SOLTU|nr:hypothetical protein KY289_037501 [Solanum tuberosum]KAH0640699.1 hypothetical protein KY285_037285 [Solanum tuberosum]KAH0739229.1 hypothetical protein KY290_037934 [Solanum tuberosum]